jgi:phage terminase large subunit-like protein
LNRHALRLNRTLGPLVVAWIEENLVHGPGDVQGQAIELDDEQVKFICRAYELDDKGRRVVRRAVFSRPKGRAKSELAGMLTCAEALGPVRFNGWDHDGKPLSRPVKAPIILCVATEEQQAGNVYEAVAFMLGHGPVASTPGLDVGLTRTYLADGGRIRPVTAKATSKEGGRETFCTFDETHLFVLPELHRLHDTIRRNLGTKRKESEPWSLEVSTMYAPGEDSVAEHSHAFAEALAAGKIRDPGFLFDHREGPDGFDFADDEQLRAALVEAYGEAAAWIDLDRLIAEARDPQTDESDFRRYFLNRATRREAGMFVKSSVWNGLAEEGLEIAETKRVCLGLDGSRTFDTTVVAWAEQREDGTIAVDACVFSVREHVAHHVLHEGGRIDFEDVEAFTIDRFELYDVAEVAYDPRYLERSAELISSRLWDGFIFPVEPSSKHMRDALQTFYRLVHEGTLRHDGDPVIAAHLANCAVERGHRDEIRRVRKIDAAKPIDAVPAMALAVWRATQAAEKSDIPLVAFV